MTRRTGTALFSFGLTVGLLVGCASGRPNRAYTESEFAEKLVLTYDLGVAGPVDGDILIDAEARESITFTPAYMMTDNFGAQMQFTYMHVVEEEPDAIIGGVFGDFRQDTRVYGLTFGPRISVPVEVSDSFPDQIELYGDAGFGGYFTHVSARFPRGDKGKGASDLASDLGISGGGGLLFHLGKGAYIGASGRVHVVFFRFGKDERFLHPQSQADVRIRDAVFFDQEGGRADELVFFTGGLVLGIRF